jgi:hypothetical protein
VLLFVIHEKYRTPKHGVTAPNGGGSLQEKAFLLFTDRDNLIFRARAGSIPAIDGGLIGKTQSPRRRRKRRLSLAIRRIGKNGSQQTMTEENSEDPAPKRSDA